MSQTAMKWIAVILMTIDHIGGIFPGMPELLRWIGRLSMPIFLFCALQSYEKTRNREAYLLRLYLCGLGMAAGDLALSLLLHLQQPIENNIFPGLLCALLAIWLPECGKKHAALYTGLFWIGGIAAAQGFLMLCAHFGWPLEWCKMPFAALTANLCLSEYGLYIVFLALLLHRDRKQPEKMALGYLIFHGLYLLCGLHGIGYRLLCAMGLRWLADAIWPLCYQSYLPLWPWDVSWMGFCQWLAVFSLPLMLLYNGQRGSGRKWFFYGYYPLHVWALYLLLAILMKMGIFAA